MPAELLPQHHVDVSQAAIKKIVDNIETVIIGKRESVELVVLAFIAQGHVLLEDLPGTGKTTLVSAMAKSVDCKFRRIQFTPDIMPSDVSGFSIFNQKTRDFEFRPGGVMSNLVLADEINRASAKTQAALLEAMEERQVTVDSQTYPLEEPFMVLATQNPIEQFGTYPLPEAQVDRFLIKLSMGYPAFEQEVEVIELGKSAKKAIKPVVSSEDILALRALAEQVHVSHMVVRYIVEIVTGTRNSPDVQVGSSPRGGIALTALTKAYALLQGRNYAVPDDVKYLAPYVLGHRIQLSHEAKVQGRDEKDVIKSIISSIAVPYEDETLLDVERATRITEPESESSTHAQAPSIESPSSLSQTQALDAQPTAPMKEVQTQALDVQPTVPMTAVQPEVEIEHPDPQITQTLDVQDTVQRVYRTSDTDERAKPSVAEVPEKDELIEVARDDSKVFEQFETSEVDESMLPSVSPLREDAINQESQESPSSHRPKKEPKTSSTHQEAGAKEKHAEEIKPTRRREPNPNNVKLPSNDIASQARARANEKRSFFGRKKKDVGERSDTHEMPSEQITRKDERRPKENHSSDSRNEQTTTTTKKSEKETRIATEKEPSQESLKDGARAESGNDVSNENANHEEETKSANSSSTDVTHIPSSPDEVDVQAAFDAAFANLSFDSDDES